MEESIASLIAATTAILIILTGLLQRRLSLDIYKDRLFRIREEWFDLALDDRSTLRFDDDVYRHVERSLCGLLSFAEMLSVFVVVRLAILSRLSAESPKSEPADPTTSLINHIEDPDTRAKALAIWRRVSFSIHNYLCARSFFYLMFSTIQTMRQPVQEKPNLRSYDFDQTGGWGFAPRLQ
jgi:hypothetical protein